MTLETPIHEQFRITPAQKSALDRLGIKSVNNLLYHFPVRYGDTAETKNISSLSKGDSAVVYGKISDLKTSKGFNTKITMADGYVEDETGKMHCVWFNQPYVAKMYTEGMMVRIEGKVSERKKNGELYFSNPKIEKVDALPIGVGDSLFGTEGESHTLYPVYPESKGISSSWIYHALAKIFKSGLLDTLEDPLPKDLLDKYHLPSLRSAIVWIHTPLQRDDAVSARKRFAFEEIFTIQLGKQLSRKAYRDHAAFGMDIDEKNVDEFVRRFPFEATEAQLSAIKNICEDMEKDSAMSRLLEGDVGSGKTAVAAAAAYAVITSKAKAKNLPKEEPQPPARHAFGIPQVAYMCPTEILATQHFESFIQYFSYMPIQIALMTGSGCRKFPSKVNPKGWTDISRAQLLKWVESGEISIVIGTHALIQESVKFRNLAFVVIDEQHRFGTAQRAKLVKKNSKNIHKWEKEDEYIEFPKITKKLASSKAPHLLSMTATPIPRTLALTLYGDLDLTVLDQSPSGRKPIITELVLPNEREAVYEKVRSELQNGRQAYVICPRIDEPDPDKEAAIIAKSVKEEARRLKEKVFQEYEIGVLHSRMSPKEKDAVMNDFKLGKIHILCATSVVEVGVNVPNATVILIEGAERFGLSQLHQLRGRVLRSSHQAYCYTFTETSSQKSFDRLKALKTAKNGFELAELDLAQRGAGELGGAKQWGVSDIAMKALKNIKMVEFAREEAIKAIENDPSLASYPLLKNKVEEYSKTAHFE